MFMVITGIDLFDQIVGMVCAKVKLRSSGISPVLNLFDQNAEMACAKTRLRCS